MCSLSIYHGTVEYTVYRYLFLTEKNNIYLLSDNLQLLQKMSIIRWLLLIMIR